MNKTRITVETTVAADKEKVWKFFTEPKHITQWNFANNDWHCPKASNDLKVGGIYKARMEAKDGSFGFDFEAVYNEVIDQKQITYSLEDGRQSTTTFEKDYDKTKITTTFDAESQNPVDMQKQGWQAILDNFKCYVETN